MKQLRIYLLNFFGAYVAAYLFFQFSDLLPFNATTSIVLFFIFYLLLWLLSFFYHKAHFRKVPKIANLVVFFIKELIIASVKVAYEVVTPKFKMQPAVIALPLDAESDLEITILASLISLTPGTLSIDVREDRKVLYVHTLYIGKGSIEDLKNSIKSGFERRILEITR